MQSQPIHADTIQYTTQLLLDTSTKVAIPSQQLSMFPTKTIEKGPEDMSKLQAVVIKQPEPTVTHTTARFEQWDEPSVRTNQATLDGWDLFKRMGWVYRHELEAVTASDVPALDDQSYSNVLEYITEWSKWMRVSCTDQIKDITRLSKAIDADKKAKSSPDVSLYKWLFQQKLLDDTKDAMVLINEVTDILKSFTWRKWLVSSAKYASLPIDDEALLEILALTDQERMVKWAESKAWAVAAVLWTLFWKTEKKALKRKDRDWKWNRFTTKVGETQQAADVITRIERLEDRYYDNYDALQALYKRGAIYVRTVNGGNGWFSDPYTWEHIDIQTVRENALSSVR